MPRTKEPRIRVWPRLRTRYQARLADRDWLSRLARFMEARLHGKVPERAWGLHCVVRGAYPHERHMGPNSVVKNEFDVVCRWWRDWRLWEWESYRASVRYVPSSGDFLLRFEELSTRETALELARRIELQRRPEIDKLVERITEGCPLSEVESFSCPRCEAPLCVAFDPESEGAFFVVSCSDDVRHAHRLAMTKQPPAWWRQKTSEWLEVY